MNLKEMAAAVAFLVLAVPASVLLRQDPGLQAAVVQQTAPSDLSEQPPQPTEQNPDNDKVFDGVPSSFFILNRSTGRVEEMSARDFVRGAVAAEMPALYHPEALKAQAVAAYTYAVRRAMEQRANPDPGLKGADFEADPENLQVCLTEKQAREFYSEDFAFYWNKVCEAADQAAKYILLYEGQPAATAYHAISAGMTEDAAHVWQGETLPYLQAVESRGDRLAAGYESCVSFTAEQLRELLTEKTGENGLPDDLNRWVVPLEWSPSGYVTLVQIGEQNITGLELRFLLGLRSSHFQVEQQDGVFTFRVQGYGHGVGLSQNGADYMARQGATFDEILLHYYSGVTLALASEQ